MQTPNNRWLVKDVAKGSGWARTEKKVRDRQRINIEKHLRQFLAQGGEIEMLPSVQLPAGNKARANQAGA